MKRVNLKGKNIAWWLTAVGLLAVSTSPSLTQGPEFKNFGLLALMCLSPLVLFIKGCRRWIPALDITVGVYTLLVLTMPLLFHPDSVRPATLAVTAVSGMFYLALARTAAASRMDVADFKGIIRVTVYLYMAVLLVQQACVLMGWPVFNAGSVYPGHPWKLNALMSEPSYTTFILSVLMYYHSLASSRGSDGDGILANFRKYPILWISYFWVISTTDNTSALVFWPLPLLPLASRRSIAPAVGILATAAVVIAVMTPAVESRHVQRVFRLAEATVTADPDRIIEADESAAFRVVPSIYGAREASVTSADDWTGHGVDADKRDLPPRPTLEEGFAGMFHVWHNYGIPAALALWLLIAMVTLGPNPATWLMTLLLLFISGECNWQFFWCPVSAGILYKTVTKEGFNPLASLRKRGKIGRADTKKY